MQLKFLVISELAVSSTVVFPKLVPHLHPKLKCLLNPPPSQIAGLYDLEETIGEGHYAVVKLARHVFTGEKVRLLC